MCEETPIQNIIGIIDLEENLKKMDKKWLDKVYNNIDFLIFLCKQSKLINKSCFYRLPVYNIEIEKMVKADIKYCFEHLPLSNKYKFKDIKDIVIEFENMVKLRYDTQYFDLNNRLLENIKSNDGRIIFEIEGVFSKVGKLIDIIYIYKSLVKNSKDIILLLNRVAEIILNEVRILFSESGENDVEFVSFADPTFSKEILGPKLYKEIVDIFYIDFLLSLRREIKEDIPIYLCPKFLNDLCYYYEINIFDKIKIIQDSDIYNLAICENDFIINKNVFIGGSCINKK